MDHNGSYVNYIGADARTLEVAYQMKKDTCELRNKFGHYRVTFLSTGITQMNVSTRKIRNVRRLLINNGPRLTPQQQQKVNQLMSFVGGGEAQCRDLLIKSKWDLQSAINGFFDSSSSRGGGYALCDRFELFHAAVNIRISIGISYILHTPIS